MDPTHALRNPLEPFLDQSSVMILDGGLATELEVKGCDLTDDLWSARLLMDQPGLIREVHCDYLHAGADCVISASYQATIEGFTGRGLSQAEATRLIRRAVSLAREARDEFWSHPDQRRGRIRPVVAASVGPYGAYLADGSEFTGDYGLTEAELEDFHRQRWHVLASSGADLLACETLPSCLEARALRRLLESATGVSAWFSFSCADGRHLNDGTPIEAMAAELEDCSQILAIGVNCTAPAHISSLLDRLRQTSKKPIVVYPNSGEIWDATARSWKSPPADAPSLLSCGEEWFRRGARLIGGCCRTGPVEIETLRRKLIG